MQSRCELILKVAAQYSYSPPVVAIHEVSFLVGAVYTIYSQQHVTDHHVYVWVVVLLYP